MPKPAMSILSLVPPETFEIPVHLPRAGRPPAIVRFTFRRRSRSEMLAMSQEFQRLDDAPAVLKVAIGWDLADEFNVENVRALCENLPGAGYAIVQAFYSECFGVRRDPGAMKEGERA